MFVLAHEGRNVGRLSCTLQTENTGFFIDFVVFEIDYNCHVAWLLLEGQVYSVWVGRKKNDHLTCQQNYF